MDLSSWGAQGCILIYINTKLLSDILTNANMGQFKVNLSRITN